MVKTVQHNDNENDVFDTLIVTVLDCSGSMHNLVNEVIGNYNWFIGEQKKFGRARVSLYRFDTEYETIYENQDINKVKKLTDKDYFARGSTALLDAVGRTIRAVDALDDKPSKIIIAINTDGYENASHEYSLSKIKELVQERTDNHDWQFVFLGAGIDKFGAQAMNFPDYSTFTFAASPAGMTSGTQSYSSGVTSYRSGVSATVDLSAVPNTAGTVVEPPKKSRKKTTSPTP